MSKLVTCQECGVPFLAQRNSAEYCEHCKKQRNSYMKLRQYHEEQLEQKIQMIKELQTTWVTT